MSEEDFVFDHIVRMSGMDLSGEWYILHALSRVRGVGKRLSHLICNIAEIPTNIRIGFLTEEEKKKIEQIIADPTSYGIPTYMVNRQKDFVTGDDIHIHSSDIPVYLKDDIDRMKKTRSYKGIRHHLGLRVRGQRTRTTGRGSKGAGPSRGRK